MIERFQCGSEEALVAFVYDECEPSEREAMAAHLSGCVSCADEVQALRDTRAHLGAWVPPAMPLGFQITRVAAGAADNVLRPARWWGRPWPAWAQVAAAAVIFAAGLSLGGRQGQAAPQAAVAAPPPVVEPVSQAAVDADALAALEERIRAIENGSRTDAVRVARISGAVADAAMLEQTRMIVDDRVAQSERRQRDETLRILTNMARQVDAFAQTAERVAFLEQSVDEHRQALRTIAAGSSLARVTSGPAGR